MAVGKVLLDTNAFSEYLGGNKEIENLLEKALTVFMPVIVIGELLIGFKGGSREKQNRSLLQIFINKPTVEVIKVSEETADIYADIFLELKKKGKPMPTNDVWIAALARETGSKLLTFDKHFLKVAGLRIRKF